MPHSKETPELRAIFSANLRLLCKSKGSIAFVCRETEINRQQFNRYLAGQSLPGRRLLAVLCSYFEKSEAQLFEDVPVKSIIKNDIMSGFTKYFHNNYKYRHPSMLLEGYYFMYCPVRNNVDSFNRGLVKISKVDSNLAFTLYATSRNNAFPSRYVRYYRYDGFATESGSVASLFGLAKNVAGSSCLMLANRMSEDEPRLMTGLLLSSRPEGSICLRYIMEFVHEAMSLRQMMRICGVSSPAYSKLDPIVDIFLKNCSENNPFLDTYTPMNLEMYGRARRHQG